MDIFKAMWWWLRRRKLNSSHNGKSSAQRRPLRHLNHLCSCRVSPGESPRLLPSTTSLKCCFSAAGPRRDRGTRGNSALHTGGHNAERGVWLRVWWRVNRKLGKTGSNSSTNSTGMVLLSPPVESRDTMDLIWNNTRVRVCVCVRVYLSGVRLYEYVSRKELPHSGQISTC